MSRDISAWQLTATLSPRATVRVAAIDERGHAQNQYTSIRRIDGPQPAPPWAVYLAGEDGRFRFICFDLDAKTPAEERQATRDADTIAQLLTTVEIPYVICRSGPTGGRHVWAALAESVDATTIGTLARLTRSLCPSLDLSQLTNPVTGCVRPPGAPHRLGGESLVLAGDVDELMRPTTTAHQVRALVEHLVQLGADDKVHDTHGPATPLPLDAHGHLYLHGPRRALPAAVAAALTDDASSGDASSVLWRVLIAAAAARWRHADVAELVATSPGLEHVRTRRDGGRRTPRSTHEATALLRRQWRKAVQHVAERGLQGADPTFDARADAIAAHVRGLQARADAAAGRWTHGGGPSDRRVLDVLCFFALQAVSGTVEADTRRVALRAGIGRTTASTALQRLAADGWIAHVAPAEGSRGAQWSIDPQALIHRPSEQGRTQADPRPVGAGAAERDVLLKTLQDRLTAAAHDLFTLPPGLGLHAGNVYARTGTHVQDLDTLNTAVGADVTATVRALDRLTAAGVLHARAGGWARPHLDQRDTAAEHRGVTGRLAARALRYAHERELWAWWQAESAWMTSEGRRGRRRRPAPGQVAFALGAPWDAYPTYPRTDRRADHRQAAAIVRAGGLHTEPVKVAA